jgi:hypothetical protein
MAAVQVVRTLAACGHYHRRARRRTARGRTGPYVSRAGKAEKDEGGRGSQKGKRPQETPWTMRSGLSGRPDNGGSQRTHGSSRPGDGEVSRELGQDGDRATPGYPLGRAVGPQRAQTAAGVGGTPADLTDFADKRHPDLEALVRVFLGRGGNGRHLRKRSLRVAPLAQRRRSSRQQPRPLGGQSNPW